MAPCHIHLGDNTQQSSEDKLSKVRVAIDILNQSFRTASRLSLDQATIPTKARISLGQVNPAKPHPYGVKSFKVCDDISYCCYLKVFEGKEDRSDNAPPLTMTVVAKLSPGCLQTSGTASMWIIGTLQLPMQAPCSKRRST
ncbi:MAG: hypothetical protein IIB77_11695 [Proteobacteria bacterium]|nr:hypothetical protein [Pseudomonadota bacterium]